MNGLYFYSPCVGFLFNKKKMSDYYGEYLFSSLYVAFPISKYQKLSDEFMFSSPHGAYLISIIKHLTAIIKPLKVFVPSRGISNLNADKVIVNFYEFVFVPSRGISNLNEFSVKFRRDVDNRFSSPPGAYLISIFFD